MARSRESGSRESEREFKSFEDMAYHLENIREEDAEIGRVERKPENLFRIGKYLYDVRDVAEPILHERYDSETGKFDKGEPGWLVGGCGMGDPNEQFEFEEDDEGNITYGGMSFPQDKARRLQEYSEQKTREDMQQAIEKAISKAEAEAEKEKK